MKKSKFYLLFALLTVMLLFSVSALCNMCGTTPATTDTVAGDTTAGKTDVEESGGSASDETTGKTDETTDKTEETTDKSDKTEETSATQDTSDYKAPTIKLEIYEGPTYSAGDDICYYRIKATVTGKPAPTVKFSKDDSNGAWGKNKVQVNIHRGETYILKATAKNSEGEDSDSMTLTWGCNSNPVISDITLSSATFVINKTYDITASASDPDGDSLTYKWTVSSGAINNGTANPMKWTTPGTVGDCTITVLVTDGKGGEATESKTVSVSAPVEQNADIAVDTGISGYIIVKFAAYPGTYYTYVGDYSNDRQIKAYLSFNISAISSLANVTIKEASVTMPVHSIEQHPETMPNVHVRVFDYGPTLEIADQGSGGDFVKIFPATNPMASFDFSSPELAAKLQSAVNAASQRFQLKLSLEGINTNGIGDYYRFILGNIVLHVKYETPG